MIEGQMKRTKWIFLSLVLVSSIVATFYILRHRNRTFTPERWLTATAHERGWLARDLYKKGEFVGKIRSDIKLLLGEPDSTYRPERSNDDNWYYEVGTDAFTSGGWIFKIGYWTRLKIEFDNDIVFRAGFID